MTKEEIINHPKEYLTPAQVASVLGQDPQYIRIAAKLEPDSLPYPYYQSGNRIKIIKEGFIKFMGWDKP